MPARTSADSRDTAPARSLPRGGRRVPGAGALTRGLTLAVAMVLACGAAVPGPATAASRTERSSVGGIHDPWNVDAVVARGPIDGDDAYHAAMFNVFISLARDRESVIDWRGVEFYLDKAKRMIRGDLPDPTVVYDPTLMILWRAPLEAARERFMAARDGGGRSLAPEALAQAHGFLDCWIREAMENQVGVELPQQMDCRMSFEWAILEVEHTMSGDAVVLLPDPDGGVGAVVLRARAGGDAGLTLETAGAGGALGAGGGAPRPVSFSESDTEVLFGDALAAQPPPPRRFTLAGFQAGTATLPPGAGAVLAEVVAEARRRGAYDVQIVGLTDTVGDQTINEHLGEQRAGAVRADLVAAGLDTRYLSIAGQGETLLAVETGDNVDEERNRRVVITVR
ncbi:OmpA family protein [Roseospira visakhapatnamensis]|uniref:Outer membrane protein OmpA-like peptidoglycan-associated protein n=1 Tax=Roseospira visakhapatnamensis TaxID=390880 RepID=A0A7W6W8D1_9PROT|nr:OmpA family protein [Roseospira visakhapatnamensis]MBB4264890.1 outer membrane protein OmpA-like peptidoglycan-associated protein [Roseospira visakhapatnamensis]